MKANIYQPAKTAMQSGKANTQNWVLEFDQTQRKTFYIMTGWTSSGDMRQQLRLKFPSKEAAVEYAVQHGIEYRVQKPKVRKVTIQSYADNFK
jgi:hypothetical protein